MNVSSTVGRLKYFLNNWKQIARDKFISSCVRGYKIVFHKEVKQTLTASVKFGSVEET